MRARRRPPRRLSDASHCSPPRQAYSTREELTVDYGISYRRNYNSASHRAVYQPYEIPPDEIDPAHVKAAAWPSLPGWWNPRMQPRRAAFARQKGGAIAVVDDDPTVVLRRHRGLVRLLPIASVPTRVPRGGHHGGCEWMISAVPLWRRGSRPRGHALTPSASE